MADIKFFDTLDSTNLEALRLLQKSDLPHGFCVCSKFQTNGRGQRGNEWESQNDENLLFSLVLKSEKIPIENQFILSKIVSVAFVDALCDISIDAKIKWPNDIFHYNKKLAGILIENIIEGNKMKYSVVGIGLNVNQLQFEHNADTATSLTRITNVVYNKTEVLSLLVEKIVAKFNLLNPSDTNLLANDYFFKLYRNSGFHMFEDCFGKFYAKIVAVADNGIISLQTDSGDCKNYYFKQIKFVL